MIRVTVSQLENARHNPAGFGQALAETDKAGGGGNRGMFTYMTDVIRLVHTGTLNRSDAVRELHTKFLRFNITRENKVKQDRLVEQMIRYLDLFEKNKFRFIDGTHRIHWDITTDVALTGLTPWVVKKGEEYFSYLLAEKTFDWRAQLRFPLYQQYLTEHTVECDSKALKIGLYLADSNRFDFKIFSVRELRMAVDEAGQIFTEMYREYKKRKL